MGLLLLLREDLMLEDAAREERVWRRRVGARGWRRRKSDWVGFGAMIAVSEAYRREYGWSAGLLEITEDI